MKTKFTSDVYSTLTHPLPQPAVYYKRIAKKLRKLGLDVGDRDFEVIDTLIEQVRAR